MQSERVSMIELRIAAAERAEACEELGLEDLAKWYWDARETLIALNRRGYVRQPGRAFQRLAAGYVAETGDGEVRICRTGKTCIITATRRGVRGLAARVLYA